MNKFNIGIIGLVLLISGCATSYNYSIDEGITEAEVSAVVTIEMTELALGIGFEKGEGILTYQGDDYSFKLSGIDYGSISKVTMTTVGSVYRLNELSDFEGVYFQAKAALTLGESGKASLFLVNRHGVTIHLSSEEKKGFDLALGRGGIKIKFLKV